MLMQPGSLIYRPFGNEILIQHADSIYGHRISFVMRRIVIFLEPAGEHIDTCCNVISKHCNGSLLISFVLLTNSCHFCTLILLETCVSFVTDYYFALCPFER